MGTHNTGNNRRVKPPTKFSKVPSTTRGSIVRNTLFTVDKQLIAWYELDKGAVGLRPIIESEGRRLTIPNPLTNTHTKFLPHITYTSPCERGRAPFLRHGAKAGVTPILVA